MTKAKLEFHMKRAEVDMDEVTEPDDEDLVNEVIKLCEEDKHEEAASVLLDVMHFECSWGNMDCDPSAHLVSAEDILIDCSNDNTDFRVGVDDGELVITAAIHF